MNDNVLIDIIETMEYVRWFEHLRDRRAQVRIAARIRRVSLGDFGSWRSVGGGIAELKIDFGPGYRVYFTRRGRTVVILLAGGDKATQRRDIERAQTIAHRMEGDT
ncbi:MAG: type II toxin-antitoxin system RelE/ParE family toxin [Actinobacteria bacterium]|nr:type II toxin-antitoxin system RelE/ParE family toxin [Actinomycetota bacterium]